MKNEQLLIDQFLSRHPEIAIDAIEELEAESIASLIESLSISHGLTILSQLVSFKAGKVMEKLPTSNAVEFIELMPLYIAESILRVCEKSVCDQILNGVTPEKSKFLRSALSFKKDQVGAHLEPFVFTLLANMSVEKALALIKSSQAVIKPHVFVIDEEKKLVGYIELAEIVKNRPDKRIKSLMKTITHSVFAEMSAKDLLGSWDNTFIDLPVVKVNGEFMGTVSRVTLSELDDSKPVHDRSAIKAGNALGELYAIGLTSLLGSAESNLKS